MTPEKEQLLLQKALPVSSNGKESNCDDVTDSAVILDALQRKQGWDFYPRDIGKGTAKCFDCGRTKRDTQHEMQASVNSNLQAKEIARKFSTLQSFATIDKKQDPNNPIMRIGSCESHLPKLESLRTLVRLNGNRIHPLLIEAAKNTQAS